MDSTIRELQFLSKKHELSWGELMIIYCVSNQGTVNAWDFFSIIYLWHLSSHQKVRRPPWFCYLWQWAPQDFSDSCCKRVHLNRQCQTCSGSDSTTLDPSNRNFVRARQLIHHLWDNLSNRVLKAWMQHQADFCFLESPWNLFFWLLGCCSK